MNVRVKLLKELVADGLYVVDEPAIARAIVLRSEVRRGLPGVAFRDRRMPLPEVRSFRPHRGAPSFRLVKPTRRCGHGAALSMRST